MNSMWNRHRDRRGFTLIELLVVMGIIAILGVITTVSYSAIAKDARLASAKNTVAAVLDTARGLAMKNNRVVVVVFRPMIDGYNKQRVEAVTAQWSGESVRVNVGGGWQVVDRFVEIPSVATRILPQGIKVAGPAYGSDLDLSWNVLTHLPKINQSSGNGEAAGEIIGVMYAADGTTISRNTATDSARMFVDFDNGGDMDWGGGNPIDFALPIPSTTSVLFNSTLFEHHLEGDEPFVDIAPFIAVFDDDDVRQLYDPNRWDLTAGGSYANRINDYTQYISNNIDPIYFNRYTGVAMR